MKDHLERLVAGHSPLRGRNLTREYLQARILGSLQRAGAMTALAFQGGTCLRFIFGLPRYSEDLDFAREREPAGYSLRGGLRAIRSDLSAEGYKVDLRVREPAAVHSALVRFPGILHAIGLSPRPAEVLAVKIEIDVRPPAGATTDVSAVRRHETLRLFHHDRASLLAGKLHAVLQRPYTKGRDLYDLIWLPRRPRVAGPQPRNAERRAPADSVERPRDDAANVAASVADRLEALDRDHAGSVAQWVGTSGTRPRSQPWCGRLRADGCSVGAGGQPASHRIDPAEAGAQTCSSNAGLMR